MAMVLSSHSRLLVGLCFCLLVLAGVLAVGSLSGWFRPLREQDLIPARLRQKDKIRVAVIRFCVLPSKLVNDRNIIAILNPVIHRACLVRLHVNTLYKKNIFSSTYGTAEGKQTLLKDDVIRSDLQIAVTYSWILNL